MEKANEKEKKTGTGTETGTVYGLP